MDTGGGPSFVKDITLRLDRPFLFFVRDVDTGAILFMGPRHGPVGGEGELTRPESPHKSHLGALR
jgi:Serpin (serine protease inhibitor)